MLPFFIWFTLWAMFGTPSLLSVNLWLIGLLVAILLYFYPIYMGKR